MRLCVAATLVFLTACGPEQLAAFDDLETPAILSRGLGGTVFINEVLANEPGSDSSMEFVELVNGSSSEVNLSGWKLSDASLTRHVFAQGTVLAPKQALVVFAGPSIPAGVNNAVAASTGALGLSNGGDTVTLSSANGSVDIATLSAALTGFDGVSANRSPDGVDGAPFVLHNTLSTQGFSPGTRADGDSFANGKPTPKPDPEPNPNPGPVTPTPVPVVTGDRFRVIAANLTSGNQQSYDTGEGGRIMKGLKPDVVLIQEFNVGDNSETALRKFVDDTFGKEYSFYREAGAAIPNGVISRFPILSAGQWADSFISNRDYAWARLDVPGNRELVAISLHLSASSGSSRVSQGAQVAQYVQEHVLSSDFLVVGGDMNTGSGEAISQLGKFAEVGMPAPVDQAGKAGTNRSRGSRYDWVIPNASLAALHIPVKLGNGTFNSGLVVDTRVYSPLSDIAPAQSGDSGSSNMQHMAVVRDFQMPK